MSPYRLTRKASSDLLAILNYTARERGPDAANELELELTTAFENLASLPGLGHRKDDLTARPFYFFLRYPYYIIYLREIEPLSITAVLHSSRDIRALLRNRL